jgi:hypothetical protein
MIPTAHPIRQHSRRTLPPGAGGVVAGPVASVACMLCVAWMLVLAGCSDRLPTTYTPVEPPVDTISVNSFVLDGAGWNNVLFNLNATPARAYTFPNDSLTSIWKGDLVPRSGGAPVQVTLQIDLPQAGAGVYAWGNAIAQPTVRSKAILRLDAVEFASESGETQVWSVWIAGRLLLQGHFNGTMRARSDGRTLLVRDGRFLAEFF